MKRAMIGTLRLKNIKIPRAKKNVDILDWWRIHEHAFPRLAQMARDLLGSMASSVPVERLFSTAKKACHKIDALLLIKLFAKLSALELGPEMNTQDQKFVKLSSKIFFIWNCYTFLC